MRDAGPGVPICKDCSRGIDPAWLRVMNEAFKDWVTSTENITQLPSTNATTQTVPPNQTEEDGLSGGGVAGLVIGVILAIVIIIVVIIILYKRRLLPGRSRKQDTVIFSFDTSFQNLINCPNTARRDSDSRSYTSSRTTNTARSSRSKASTPPSTYAHRHSAGYTSSNPYQKPFTDYYTQARLNYEASTASYMPSSTNFTQNRTSYNPNSLNFAPSGLNYPPSGQNYPPNSLYYPPRDYSAGSFYYRPSRHVDRQLNAYYNWTISEESTDSGIARVHRPLV